jgi:2-methylaconitate cis-trans-isomerase PrpF
MGLIKPAGPETPIRIRAVNTGARVEATVQTPEGAVEYEGKAGIDGVPGTAAPVNLQFMDTVGGATGAFLPTGNLVDTFGGIEVTCMDVAMPMVIARAESFGLTGYESVSELNDNRAFFDAMEAVRIEAGTAMGIKNVAKSVTPKVGLLAAARDGGTVATRYFMPWSTHPTMAVTGAQCLASCILTPGSIADGMVATPNTSPTKVTLEHASGEIDVLVNYRFEGKDITIHSAGLVRTARLLVRGEVMVPRSALR